ncbi:MAG: flippase, partial [Clostridia bacterium]|nr:flippase [Clostridia bacterium]
PEQEGTVIGSTLVLRGISSVLSVLCMVFIVCFLDAGEPITIAVVALYSVGVVFNIFETFSYWFQSHLNSRVTAISSFIAYLITAAYRVVLMMTGKDVRFFAFATSVDYICVAVLLFLAYKKYGGKPLKFSWSYSKKLLSKSHHFILSGLMVSIYGQTDKLMLKHMIDETEIGYYTTAVTVCGLWTFVLTAIIDSVYPSIMEANDKDEALFKLRNKQLYAIVFYLSAFVSLMFLFFSPLVIHILYGEDFYGAINPLRIITWYTAFSYLGVARNAWLVCKDRQKYLKYIYAIAAVSNVVLNIIFIPLWGACGAAVASLIAEILTSIALPLFVKPLRENTILMLEAIFLRKMK